MNFLQTIQQEKRQYIAERKKRIPKHTLLEKLSFPLPHARFKAQLQENAPQLIAEIKRASPSKGDLCTDCDVVKIAHRYEAAGIRLVSILTEEKYFKGTLEEMERAAATTSLCVLRKDFIIDEYQVLETKAHGADALLLIVAMLDADMLKRLLELSLKFALDAVVEVHSEKELHIALECGADIIGINNRNLEDFTVDLQTAENLLGLVPHDKIIIVESGIQTADDIRRFRARQAHGFLIGESLMCADSIEEKLAEFTAALQ